MTVSRTIETVEFSGTILNETRFAILFQRVNCDEGEWIPLSQVSKIFRPKDIMTDAKINVATWLAKKKGWID